MSVCVIMGKIRSGRSLLFYFFSPFFFRNLLLLLPPALPYQLDSDRYKIIKLGIKVVEGREGQDRTERLWVSQDVSVSL